jgi:hypothetical protein
VPLPELSQQLQALLNQLNAQTTRLSNTLTQLTDDIIRSGCRLAYEVEVLRGETLGLTDLVENGLKSDIARFNPLKVGTVGKHTPQEAGELDEGQSDARDHQAEGESVASQEPEFLDRLRLLTTVRERLDAVIKTFGSAMQWPLAPSELSLASSLISVSAPDDSDDGRSREEKGREYVEKIRNEINDLLASGDEGVQAADARIGELRSLAQLWEGTAEEKARFKIVESLQKLADEKRKSLGKASADARKSGTSPARGMDYRYGGLDTARLTGESGSGYGFLRNLKNEVYMD